MTKGRATLPWRAVAGADAVFHHLRMAVIHAQRRILRCPALAIIWAIASAAWVVAEHIAPKRGVQV